MKEKHHALRFVHLRYKKREEKLSGHYCTIAALGGLTVGFNKLDGITDYYAVTVAKCNKKDRYCKATGRAICEGRFKKGDYEVINLSDYGPGSKIECILRSLYYITEPEAHPDLDDLLAR